MDDWSSQHQPVRPVWKLGGLHLVLLLGVWRQSMKWTSPGPPWRSSPSNTGRLLSYCFIDLLIRSISVVVVEPFFFLPPFLPVFWQKRMRLPFPKLDFGDLGGSDFCCSDEVGGLTLVVLQRLIGGFIDIKNKSTKSSKRNGNCFHEVCGMSRCLRRGALLSRFCCFVS